MASLPPLRISQGSEKRKRGRPPKKGQKGGADGRGSPQESTEDSAQPDSPALQGARRTRSKARKLSREDECGADEGDIENGGLPPLATPRAAKLRAQRQLFQEEVLWGEEEKPSEIEGGTEQDDEYQNEEDVEEDTAKEGLSSLDKAARSNPSQSDLRHIGVSIEDIIKLINNEETIESVIKRTGFSPTYLKKLQRRVLRTFPGLCLTW